MIKVLVAPGRYVQGAGALEDAGKFVAPLGKRALVVWDKVVHGLISARLEEGFKKNEVELISFLYSGECSRGQLALGLELAKEKGANVVVGWRPQSH